MWQNISWFGAVLLIISIVFGYAMMRIGKVEDMLKEKVDTTMCDQKSGEMYRSFDRGETTFKDINEKLEKQGKLLAGIDATVKLILERSKKDN